MRQHLSPSTLSVSNIERFERDGFLVLPGLVPRDLANAVEAETDRWVDDGHRARSIQCVINPELHGVPPLVELEMSAHGQLLVLPALMGIIEQLIGPRFVFHHMHSDRQAPDLPGKPWHHDYEEPVKLLETASESSRPPMVHALHYLDGLDDHTASLVVLPGSHHWAAAKDALTGHGVAELPGEVVIDELPPGSVVLCHSAVMHARRLKRRRHPKDRYFVDASYCRAGAIWPPVKPYWRDILNRARRRGLAPERSDLFDDRHFCEYVTPRSAAG